MGSLYEPSIRSSSESVVERGFSKRFTTLSGWREIGQGAYAMGSSNIRMFSFRNQYDPEGTRRGEFDFSQTLDRPGVVNEALEKVGNLTPYRRSSEGTIGKAIGSVRDTQIIYSNNKELPEEPPYSVYSIKEKWIIIAIVAAAGCFPMLTFNIYLPAMGRIATDLKASAEAVNLTVMTYLLAQSIAPLIWAPLSECLGRRTVYLSTFSLYVLSCIVLSFSPNLAVLVIFRGLQAAAIASAAPIGYAVIHDIAASKERCTFYAFFQGVRNAALLLAPIVGGLTSNWANFRCVFVVIFALSLAVLVALAFALPETHRNIAGNGTTPLTGIYQPLLWKVKVLGQSKHADESLAPGRRAAIPRMRQFLKPFGLFAVKDTVPILVFSGAVFAVWTIVTVTTPFLFAEAFTLANRQAFLGLALVPNFAGAIAGSALIGNLLDDDLRRASEKYATRGNAQPRSSLFSSSSPPPSPRLQIVTNTLPIDFPLEHTRLVRLPGLIITLVFSLAFYGYSLAYPKVTSLSGWICLPLLLQAVIAATAHGICGVCQTLMSEAMLPSEETSLGQTSSSSTADQDQDRSSAGSTTSLASNLIRSALSAVGVGVAQKMLGGAGCGPAFLALAGVVMVLVPLPILLWCKGEQWRSERMEQKQEEWKHEIQVRHSVRIV